MTIFGSAHKQLFKKSYYNVKLRTQTSKCADNSVILTFKNFVCLQEDLKRSDYYRGQDN